MNSTVQTTPLPHDDPAARADRLERFLAYGFTAFEAELLTDARDGIWPLYHLKVKKALDAGCTRADALLIFT